MTLNDATRAQIDAARPDASTWLTANAGSGKTRVLTDRVARLLLAGVDPQQILCLTYTKAAASEMQNRLFKRLGAWAMLEDPVLRAELAELGIEPDLPPEDLRDARTLFARAIETPGGLKIQTIHSFCSGILRRFPLEAGVSPEFTEIEDRAADLLRAEIVDAMAEGPEADLVRELARHYTGEDFGKLTKAIVGKRDQFGAQPVDLDPLFDLPVGFDLSTLPAHVMDQAVAHWMPQAITIIAAQDGTNMPKLADGLKDINVGAPTLDDLEKLKAVMLTQKMELRKKLLTKSAATAMGELLTAFEDLAQATLEAHDLHMRALAKERTGALHAFARPFITRYETAKQQRGWLDFDDLILRTRNLLSDPLVAAWVLYRIDGGIDHILVDEAQDTSPPQWDVVEKLADEFFSGAGARPEMDRTIFVVGDKKQSIYSFQGADPEELDRKQVTFRQKIEDAGQSFQDRSLDYSFRSSSAILRMVDQTFDPQVHDGLDPDTKHKAFKEELPGRVDLWPVVEKTEKPDDLHWTDPVDRKSDQHHDVILAEQIAARIKTLTSAGHFIPTDGKTSGTFVKRQIKAGDFLILVQSRGGLFDEIIRACKAADLPIAGADRLKVGGELAVKDLGALLSFLATPDDDLSLATVLRSPLFGWSEQELFTLAHHREKTHLWQALRTQRDLHPKTVSILEALRGEVDFLRPYDLIERILTRHQGRKHLLERLGPEAEDGINAMLTQALAYERSDIPSLTGFLQWMETDDLEIKRQIDSSSNQIRVMTVHGAKGLEAPIVILPDTGRRNAEIKDDIITLDGVPVWKPKASEMPRALTARKDELLAAQLRERLRLLYVAMTRAEKWLIVAAAGDLQGDGKDWYQIMQTAMGHVGSEQFEGGLRYSVGDWSGLAQVDEPVAGAKSPLLDTVFTAPVPDMRPRPDPISPSKLKGAKALSGEQDEDRDDPLSYGSLVHHLLETLAPLDPVLWPASLRTLLTNVEDQIADAAKAEAIGILQAPALAHLFTDDWLAEASVTAAIGAHRLHGDIDRLKITPEKVSIVDFKTNQVVPETAEGCPQGLLAQMGAYGAMLAQIYPDRPIETAILWTATATLMPLPHDIVSSAFANALELDDEGMRS